MQRSGSRKGAGRAAQPAGARGPSVGEGLARAKHAAGSRAAGAASDADVLLSSGGLPIRASQLIDERLARQVAKGSQRAFTTIYERYHQQLYQYCYSLLRDRDDAYDALQSTLLGAFAALRRGQRDAPLRPWLYRIAHNEAISLTRRRRSVCESGSAPETWVPSAEDRAGQRARLALLVADLQALSERERGVLLMRELSGLSHREISLALGISTHTVKHAILAARRSLREFEEGRSMLCAEVRASVSDGHGNVLRTRAHLRSCRSCADFAASIGSRRADLRALVPPLPPAAAAGLLAALHGAAASTGAGAGAGAGGGAGASLAGKTTYAFLGAKALAGVAVVAVTGATVAGAVGLAKPFAGGTAPTTTAAAAKHDHALRRSARSSRRAKARASADLRASAPVGASGGAVGAFTAPASGVSVGGGARSSQEGAQGRPWEAGSGPSAGNRSRRNGEGPANAGHGRGAERRSTAGATHGGVGGGRAGSVGHSRAPGTSSSAASEHAGGSSRTESAAPGAEHAHPGAPPPSPNALEIPAVVPAPRLPVPPPPVAPPPASIPDAEASTAGTELPKPPPPTTQPAP